MSMSNLASQLAGLNNNSASAAGGGTQQNVVVGSILPTSKRHDDAIGRGLHHNVVLGGQIMVSEDPKSKASVLYDNAKAASDVPLSMLWENCKASLRDLEDPLGPEFAPLLRAYQSVCQDKLLQRTTEENKKKSSSSHTVVVTPNLAHLLTLLGTMYETSTEPCLHILEYLLRRYNVHVTAADLLLTSWLPHAQALPQLFHRILQLVDIVGQQAQQSCWMWLRPYARTQAQTQALEKALAQADSTATKKQLLQQQTLVLAPPRHVVAQQVISNAALLQQVCRMTQTVAHIASLASENHTPRSMQQIVSWSATILVQGLVHLQRTDVGTAKANLKFTTTTQESTLRVLLPVCCHASSSATPLADWIVWGHIVASAVAETMELAPMVRNVLCWNILKGAIVGSSSCSSNSSMTTTASLPSSNKPQPPLLLENGGNATNISAAAIVMGDALVAILSVCIPVHSMNYQEHDVWQATRDDFTKYLTLAASSSSGQDDNNNDEEGKDRLLESLWKNIIVPSSSSLTTTTTPSKKNKHNKKDKHQSHLWKDVVTYLYHHRHMDIFMPVAVQILVWTVLTHAEDPRTRQVLVEWMQYESWQSMWKPKRREEEEEDGTNLIHNLSEWLIWTYLEEYESNNKDVADDEQVELNPNKLQLYQSLLQELRRLDGSQCERGMARAMQDNDTMLDKKRLTVLLQGILSPSSRDSSPNHPHNTRRKRSLSTDDNKMMSSDNNNANAWLPPRVALEHADPEVRLHAMKQLIKELKDTNKDAMEVEEDDDEDDIDATESVEQALGRRMASDDNPTVVLTAAAALKELIVGEASSNTNHRGSSKSRLKRDDVLATLYQWAFVAPSSSEAATPEADKEGENDKDTANATTKQSIVTNCLQILGCLVEKVEKEGTDPSRWQTQIQPVLEAVTLHLENVDAAVSHAAAETIVNILGDGVSHHNKKQKSKSKSKPQADLLHQAKQLLVEQTWFITSLVALEKESGPNVHYKDAKDAFRRRSLWVMLAIMEHYVKSQNGKDSNDSVKRTSQAAVDACVSLLLLDDADTYRKDKAHAKRLRNVWRTCSTRVAPETIPQSLVSLASCRTDQMYEVVRNFIQAMAENVKHETGEAVSVYSVLMEAAWQENASSKAAKRLLALATDLIFPYKEKHPTARYCVVPALAFLEHGDEAVRVSALGLLSTCGKFLESAKYEQYSNWKPLTAVCNVVKKQKSNAVLGGLSYIPRCLAAAGSSSNVRECLLALTVAAAVSCGLDAATTPQELMDTLWMPFGQASGQVKAVVAVLRAMELAGESAFPLKLRWEGFGAPLLAKLTNGTLGNNEVSDATRQLCDCVVGLLKGISVTDTGTADSGLFDPYPETMAHAIVDILALPGDTMNGVSHALSKPLLSNVLGSKTWTDTIFVKLPVELKTSIASKLLSSLAGSSTHARMGLFVDLPLDASDINALRSQIGSDTDDLPALSILADYIRSNSKALILSPGISELLANLFDTLATLSSSSGDDFSDEIEFVRQSMLSASRDLMLELAEEKDVLKALKIAQKTVKGWVDMLLAVNGNATILKNVRALESQRAKAVSLSLLAAMCSSFPKAVVTSLIPAMIAQIEATGASSDESKQVEVARSTFDSIVPVYLEYASHAGLAFHDLLDAFVKNVRLISDSNKRMGLYSSLLASMAACGNTAHDDASTGAVVAFYFAGEAGASDSNDDFNSGVESMTEFALQLIEKGTASAQMSSILLLLYYVDSMFLLLQEGDVVSEPLESTTSFEASSSYLPKVDAIVKMLMSAQPKIQTKKGAKSAMAGAKDRIMKLAQICLLALNDTLLLESVQRFIRRSERNNTSLSLRLWQDLLIVQATASLAASAVEGDGKYWDTTIRSVGESLDHIQNLMPLPTFLASASSLIKDGETDELRAGAMRLVADRAPEVRPGTPEASLFLDMAALLVSFVKTPEKVSPSSKESLSVLQQSALVAIEHIARSHHSLSSSTNWSGPTSSGTSSKTFLSALQGCSELFVRICGQGKKSNVDIGQLEDSSRKLLCSASLCTATLVRVTAPRCLSLLPRFMNQLIESLSSANTFVLSLEGSEETEVHGEARLIQVCLLRALTAVAESVPHFIYPYLKKLLNISALPSKALWKVSSMDHTVQVGAESLEKSLSVHVPARVLIPVVSKALTSLQDPIEFDVLLRMLQHSVDASSGEEMIGHLRPMLRAVTTTYDFQNVPHITDRMALVDAANEAVLAMVLKLSEVHLRRLYAALRDWRGDLDAEQPDKYAMRRFAFWKVSVDLAKELRTIFLPCLSNVLTDAINELVCVM